MSLIVMFFLLGTCFYLCVDNLGDLLGSIVYYGKVRSDTNGSNRMQVPKTRFKDMYTTGLLCVIVVYYRMVSSYFLDNPVPDWILIVLDYLGGVDRRANGKDTILFLKQFY